MWHGNKKSSENWKGYWGGSGTVFRSINKLWMSEIDVVLKKHQWINVISVNSVNFSIERIQLNKGLNRIRHEIWSRIGLGKTGWIDGIRDSLQFCWSEKDLTTLRNQVYKSEGWVFNKFGLLQTAKITNVGCYKLSKTQVAILIKEKKGCYV